MANDIKYNVGNNIFTRKETLDLYNNRRQGEGLPKIYSLKLLSICENISINKIKKKLDFEN